MVGRMGMRSKIITVDLMLTGFLFVFRVTCSSGEIQRIRGAARQLYSYRGYQDVQLIHYKMPEQALWVNWTFTVNESAGCRPRNVSLYIQHGSYPVINPDGSTFPQRFLIQRTSLQNIPIQSDSRSHSLHILKPQEGDWYAAAFLPTPNNDIRPKGLGRECHTWFGSVMDVESTNHVIHMIPEIHAYQEIQLYQHLNRSQTYKFYVTRGTWRVVVNVSRCTPLPSSQGVAQCPILLTARPRALPAIGKTFTSVVNCSLWPRSDACALSFIPFEESWHYLTLIPSTPRVEFGLKVGYESCSAWPMVPDFLLVNDLDARQICSSINKTSKLRVLLPSSDPPPPIPVDNCWNRVPLERETMAGNFLFDYRRPRESENGSVQSILLQLDPRKPSLMTFDLEPVLDIGGTLAFVLGLDSSSNSSLGFPRYHTAVVACINLGTRSTPLWPKNCTGIGYPLQVNSTHYNHMSTDVQIPFPEPGTWHISLQVFCFIPAHGSFQEVEIMECEGIGPKVLYSLGSTSCIYGRCGPHGRCYQYISGGLIFSTCVCSAGYRGWGCTDSSQAIPEEELLIALLLLTLSNVLFLPAIVIALRRRYYTEALVYTCTMLFSTFYHACDADEGGFSWCIIRLGVLQFADFYSALLSLWVTLIAMAVLPTTVTSIAHVGGALGLALGVEMDRTEMWVFVTPAIIGAIAIIISWIFQCRRQHKIFPRRLYLLLCLIPGLIIASVGISCFAFLETKDNYRYIHSTWHGCMALSIFLLLPFQSDKEEGLDYESQGLGQSSGTTPSSSAGRLQHSASANQHVGNATTNSVENDGRNILPFATGATSPSYMFYNSEA